MVLTRGTNHAERVFLVQQAFTQLGGETHTLGELARVSKLDDSTVYRILQSGVYHGTFMRVGRGKYQLGPPAAQLATQLLFHAPKTGCISTALQRLRSAGDGGLAFFHILTYFGGARRECIEMAVGDSDLTELGMTPQQILAANRCLRLSTSGRVMLAYLHEPFREQVLAAPLPPEAGPGVYRDNDRLRVSLTRIREQGYAVGLEECVADWNSYASPVTWGDSVIGAVTLLKPASVVPVPDESSIAATKAAGAEISYQLGHLPGPRPPAGATGSGHGIPQPV
ncbi:IclR family transcriptional regulator C-terminal domain-containing protein [Streptomyces sp. NPDC004647]|uniref:IclR family transcriptional regulator domain-containing protein n=1 Tax=Streptomyces sp. NPDC004647 TaxID=3154671 RepID=UPI0033ADAF5D